MQSFVCTDCSKVFKKRSSFIQHERVHSGDRPFVCDHEGCGKRFAQAGNLVQHKISHNFRHLRWMRGECEKPHKCTHPNCTKSFISRSSLATHVRNSHINKKNKEGATGEVSTTVEEGKDNVSLPKNSGMVVMGGKTMRSNTTGFHRMNESGQMQPTEIMPYPSHPYSSFDGVLPPPYANFPSSSMHNMNNFRRHEAVYTFGNAFQTQAAPQIQLERHPAVSVPALKPAPVEVGLGALVAAVEMSQSAPTPTPSICLSKVNMSASAASGESHKVKLPLPADGLPHDTYPLSFSAVGSSSNTNQLSPLPPGKGEGSQRLPPPPPSLLEHPSDKEGLRFHDSDNKSKSSSSPYVNWEFSPMLPAYISKIVHSHPASQPSSSIYQSRTALHNHSGNIDDDGSSDRSDGGGGSQHIASYHHKEGSMGEALQTRQAPIKSVESSKDMQHHLPPPQFFPNQTSSTNEMSRNHHPYGGPSSSKFLPQQQVRMLHGNNEAAHQKQYGEHHLSSQERQMMNHQMEQRPIQSLHGRNFNGFTSNRDEQGTLSGYGGSYHGGGGGNSQQQRSDLNLHQPVLYQQQTSEHSSSNIPPRQMMYHNPNNNYPSFSNDMMNQGQGYFLHQPPRMHHYPSEQENQHHHHGFTTSQQQQLLLQQQQQLGDPHLHYMHRSGMHGNVNDNDEVGNAYHLNQNHGHQSLDDGHPITHFQRREMMGGGPSSHSDRNIILLQYQQQQEQMMRQMQQYEFIRFKEEEEEHKRKLDTFQQFSTNGDRKLDQAPQQESSAVASSNLTHSQPHVRTDHGRQRNDGDDQEEEERKKISSSSSQSLISDIDNSSTSTNTVAAVTISAEEEDEEAAIAHSTSGEVDSTTIDDVERVAKKPKLDLDQAD